MNDMAGTGGKYAALFAQASTQQGYFTTRQATDAGYTRPLLTYHTKTGQFERIRPGIYRLRDYPSSPTEEIMAAWLAAGKDSAVISHESALALLGLSDVIPNAVHLSVPRAQRYRRRPLPGTVVHTSTRPPSRQEITEREGIRLTGATRSIVDAAEAGTAPEQIELAIRQALDRGLTTPALLKKEADDYSRRVRDLVTRTLVLR